jgi:hypothetical protein
VSDFVHDVVWWKCGFGGQTRSGCGKRGVLHKVGVFGGSLCQRVKKGGVWRRVFGGVGMVVFEGSHWS